MCTLWEYVSLWECIRVCHVGVCTRWQVSGSMFRCGHISTASPEILNYPKLRTLLNTVPESWTYPNSLVNAKRLPFNHVGVRPLEPSLADLALCFPSKWEVDLGNAASAP